MIRTIFFVIAALTAMLFVSCDDTTDTIGNSLTSNVDQFEIVTDTFDVSTKSIRIDSVLAKSLYSYLGHIKDEETGSYVTCNYTTQFAILESLDGFPMLPAEDSICSLDENKEIIADSCRMQIYFYSTMGDTLNPMKMTAYELAKPIEEGHNYYTDYNPEEEGLLRSDANAIKKGRTYTALDLNLSDSARSLIVDKTNMHSVFISLNDEYVDTKGKHYNNYGTYLMRKYYENPNNFKNSYNFIHNVCPGFYIKSTDGIGVMSEVYLTELAFFYKYKNDTILQASTVLSGTEEVLQTTNIVNDSKSIDKLLSDNSCTYIKSPAGIFTEVTIPVEQIKYNHEQDTISSAKIVFNRITPKEADNNLPAPTYLLMLPKDSLFSFFEKKDLPDYKTSYIGTYSGSYNTYTFDNISGMVSKMYEAYKQQPDNENWNKVVLVPVSIKYNSSSTSNTITNVSNEMLLRSTRLVGGPANSRQPIKLSVIYNKFTKD